MDLTEDTTQPQTDKVPSDRFILRTEVFEGPLDLLLNLVEKRKLFINDISLAKVTDEYIQYVNRLPDYSLHDRTQFISIASTLLLIKAKSLLPTIELTPEEESNINDLQDRLKELEIIRKASIVVKEHFGKKMIFERGEMHMNIKLFVPSKDTTANEITDAINRVLISLPKTEQKPKIVVKKVLSIEEVIDRLTDRIQKAMRMSFREFSGNKKPANKEEKVLVIVSFLAMLELVKQGILDARQNNLFDEIEMESQKEQNNDTIVKTPHYA